MLPPSKNIRSAGKQFRLVKFFAWASFIVLVIFFFPFSMVISQKAKETLLESYESNAILVGENLNHQVFQNFVLPVNLLYGQIRLKDKEQYELMDKIVRNAIHGTHVDLVNVYDIGEGIISYSTDPKLIGQKVKESLEYKKAIEGESSSGLITIGDDFWGLGLELIGAKKTLRTYIPFRVEIGSTVGIGGVFELIQDMSTKNESIVKFQYLIFGLSVLIMGLIFLAHLLIVYKAEGMIEQRAKEQHILEAQLNQAERLAALGEMVAGISHEIKNPLGIIRSTSELLGEMSEASDTQRRLSKVITEESTRLNQIVTEFLDFARPQIPNLHECYLEEIIEKNLSFIRPELDKKGIAVNDNLNGRSLKLIADQDLLYQAFLNILINAIQSMQDGGTIDIKVEEERNNYHIEIKDTGCGIDAENVNKIFNPFFTTKEKGSGLGLSIVRKIVEGHKGTINIQSKEGEGTKVKVQLPRRG